MPPRKTSGSPPAAAPKPVPKSEGMSIARWTDAAWWCPLCDHSQLQAVTVCQGCGATSDGERVTSC